MNKQQIIKTAILIVESFETQLTFSPAFLDFNSAPAIEFNISWLIQNNIKQCFIMYSKSKYEVQKYFSTFQVKQIKLILIYVKEAECKSLGDFLREVNFRQLVNEDFLLVHGDIITNLSLKAIIEEHLKRKIISKINILTVGLTVNTQNSNIFVIHKSTKQIVQMQTKSKQFQLNTQRCKFNNLCQYQIRGDLQLNQLYICSPEVLKTFKQNFEFQNMTDFINGMLTTQIYEKKKIFSYVLKISELSSKLSYPRQYYQAYINLISRYLYPFTVQNGSRFFKSQSKYITKYIDYNKYIKSNCQLSNVKISHGVYIGQQSIIGSGSYLLKTIVNRNCIIGEASILKFCIIAQGTILPSNSIYKYSFIYSYNNKLIVKCYKDLLVDQQVEVFDTQQLFPEPPPVQQQCCFNKQLEILLSQPPTRETFEELCSLLKIFKKQPKELIIEFLIRTNPSTVKQIEKCIQVWGGLLKKICLDDGLEFTESIIFSAQKNETIKRAFHIFLQYLYKFDHLSSEQIIEWYGVNKQIPEKKHYIELSQPFIQILIQQQNQDHDHYDQ